MLQDKETTEDVAEKEQEVTMLSVVNNHRGTIGFALGAIIVSVLGMMLYVNKYGQLATEGAILKAAFERVEYNNEVCNKAVENNKVQNEIISAHIPKYLDEIGKTLAPKQQKVVSIEKDEKDEEEVSSN